MSYRFLKIASFYEGFLAQYYKRFTAAPTWSYQEQFEHLMAQGFGWADYFEKNFRSIGIEAFELVENALPLQQAWARENVTPEKAGLELILAQIERIRPTVLFLQDPLRFDAGWVKVVRERVPSIRLVIGWLCAPYSEEHIDVLREMDFLLTCTPGFVEEFKSRGLPAYLSVHAFEGSLLPRLEVDNPYPETDMVFVGSLFAGESFHDMRGRILAELLDNDVGIDVYGQIVEPSPSRVIAKSILHRAARVLVASKFGPYIERRAIVRRALRWEAEPRWRHFSEKLRRHIQPPVYGIEMLRVLSKSRLAFNVHIGVAGSYAGNVRLFEATGAGTCLLTDWKENIPNLFEVDSEVVTFRSPEECAEKARWLMEHPRERIEIAKAGQKRTLRDYGYDRRVLGLDSQIRARLYF